MVIGNADGGHGQEWLKPSLEIRAVHQLIARYWNVVTPSESTGSGTNMPIILYLHDHRHEDVFQYDIERAFSITRSTASRVLALMEKKGLITRTSVQWDARVRKIELTAAADGIVEELQRRSRQLERTLFEGFSDDEQRRFLADLERMQSNLYATGLLGKETPGCACAHPPADEEQHGDGARAPADASPTRPQQSADTDTTDAADAADAADTTNTTNNDPDDADGPNKPSDSSEAHRFQPEKAKKGAEQ